MEIKYKIGDYVVHKFNGVCQVVDIKKEDYGNGIESYYVLESFDSISKMHIMIPTANCPQLRDIITTEEANKIVEHLPKSKDIWIKDARRRKERYNEIIDKGSYEDMCDLLHTLYFKKEEYKKNKKPIPIEDKKIFDLAEKILFGELSISLGIDKNEISNYINSKLFIN